MIVVTGATGHIGRELVRLLSDAGAPTRAVARHPPRDDGAVDHVSESEDEAWHRLRTAGQPTWRIAALLAIASYQRMGGATEAMTHTVEELTGRPPRTLREFAVDHAELLRA